MQKRKISLDAFSSDLSQNSSDGPTLDVVPKVIDEVHSTLDSLELDDKSQELQFNLLAACAGLDR